MYTVNIYYGHWSELRQIAFIKGNDKTTKKKDVIISNCIKIYIKNDIITRMNYQRKSLIVYLNIILIY